MIRIRCIHSGYLPINRDRIEQVKTIFAQAFPDLAEQADKIPQILQKPLEHNYNAALIVLERGQGKANAFALILHFPHCNSVFLDYLAVRKDIRGGGLGTALYEAVREYCQDVAAHGLYMEVQPDDPALTTNPEQLAEAKKRIRFYEKYGVKTIINPIYSQPVGSPPTTAYLLYDALGRTTPLAREEAKDAVRMILSRRFAHISPPQYIKKVLEAFPHDPVQFLSQRYIKAPPPPGEVKTHRLDRPFVMVSSQKHIIHHVKQRGYFERPTRVGVLKESLGRTGMFTSIEPAVFSESAITDIHDRHFVQYLKTICTKLAKDKPVYPDTFPIRRPDRRPGMFPEQAGYYCIDSCTPLDGNAFIAARAAVNVALTAAREILVGHRVVYALCRPPGHHAEKRVYGGFCYFNNAAIAAHHFSQSTKVAVLDIDHHHGNGTQDIFYDRSDVLTVSIHGHPDNAFPYFSGFPEETGTGPGLGFNLNLPLPRDSDEKIYLPALEKALRTIRKFKPEILVVSLGLDILAGDPTGTFMIAPAWMSTIAQHLKNLKIPLLIVQEGGYNLRGIKKGAAHFFKGLA